MRVTRVYHVNQGQFGQNYYNSFGLLRIYITVLERLDIFRILLVVCVVIYQLFQV
jgi:hypothetical protein